MAITFLKGSELNTALEHLIEDADNYLYLICPYFHLHEKLKVELKDKRDQPNLKIVVMFGKNEEGIHKSLKKEDFDFLKTFPNIEIRYEPKLHAKYYASEDRAIITSLNLLQYSHDHNIEVGVIMDVKGILGSLGDLVSSGNSAEGDSYLYFEKVIKNSELKYQRVPTFEKAMLGLKNEYKGSNEKVDLLSEIYESSPFKTLKYKWESKQNDDKSENNKWANNSHSEGKGYCIRTGQQIPFNLKKPFCSQAFSTWSQFGNKDYAENYCHFSGEDSNGNTSFANPILKRNWRKAKELHKF
ncbi:phospholipase D-like domain-containing protein [Desertivirga brevis]|uniref:phospholipase D-like domain-containing protein n=1 Tax=Desertivirga brevis TaxID=2810310 RepID=UPI001A96FD3F|nr:phospholipase D-like domain-containing protein [Pedobacter sp. SYSU D00873]